MENPRSLDAVMDLTIRIDNWLWELREEKPGVLQLSYPCALTSSPLPPAKPMQVDVGCRQLIPVEKE